MKTVATIISRLFDPLVMLAGILVTVFVVVGEPLSVAAPALLLIVGIPAGLVLWARHRKIISNWDISVHTQRKKAMLILTGIELLLFIGLKWFVQPHTFAVFFYLLVAFVGFAVLTQFYKLSGHVMMGTLACGFVVLLFGVRWWPLFLVLVPVGWARITLKRHSLLQVIAGFMYGAVLVVFIHALMT